jgi:acetyltransferase-like isoleucine patch superfamily enzyme
MVKYLSSWVISFLLNELKKLSSDELLKLLNQKAASSWYHIFCDGHPNGSVKFPFHCHGSKYIKLGHNFHAGAGFRIEAWDCYQETNYTPEIRIGDNCCINNNVHIGAINRIWIGNNVLIGSNVLITDHTHGCCSKEELAIPPVERKLFSKGSVVIGNNVLIGENVCILAGVTIGSGAVIGAGAVVTRNIPEQCIATGVPAAYRMVK